MSQTIQNILSEELSQLRQEIINRHELAGQVATGQTREAIQIQFTGEKSAYLEIPAYFGIMETGRASGAVPAGFKDILYRWASAKGLSFSTDADFNRWAYFVTKKIKEEGTTLYRSGQINDIYTTPIAEFEERITSRVSAYYYNQLITHLF